MLHKNRRWVFIFDLTLEPIPDNGPIFRMQEVALRVEKLFKDGDAFHLTQDDTIATRISGCKFDLRERTATFLIQYANKNASDPVFASLDKGDLREEPKLPGEGIAVSAHMVISLDPLHPDGNQYVVAFEEVPGLTRSHVTPFLKAIFKKAFEGETYRDPDTNSVKRCRPAAELSGHLDQTLEEVLEGKKLQSITLVSYKPVKEFDGHSYLVPMDHSVKLKVVKEPENRRAWLAALRKDSYEKGYESMRIFYRDPKRTSKKQQSLKLEKKQDAAVAYYTRQEEIWVDEDLGQCHPKIHTDLNGKMKTLLFSIQTTLREKAKDEKR